MKKLFDTFVSGTVLLILSPILIVIIVLLRLTGEGCVFFLQDRVGFKGKIIRITKFATMLKDSPSIGAKDITLANDPRILPLGRFLRKSKLNELPQLWDVLVGKLSLVGWRPLLPSGFSNYPSNVQQKLLQVRPGITGLGSIVFRNEEMIIAHAEKEGRDLRHCYREDIMPFKGELESWYVDHSGFVTDLKILLATAFAVLNPKWRGFWKWFPGIPKPANEILKEELGV